MALNKVLVGKPSGGAYAYISKGFINAFRDIGIEAKYHDTNEKDFVSFGPDLYIGCSGHRHKMKKIPSGVKIAIHVNPHGTRLEPIHGVDINEPADTIAWTVKQDPDVVFGYGLQKEEQTFWKNWRNNHGIPFVGLPTAGDATIYYPDKKEVDYKVAYLGGKWPYKSHNIDKYLVPTINKLGDKVAIHGWGGWQGFSSYRGHLPENDTGRQFLSSAKVCPCICEPHTTVYGIDVPERFFKAALCGSLPVIDKMVGFDRYMKNYIMAETPDQYYQLVSNYACNPDYESDRIELALVIRSEVLGKHTYHNRMRDLCAALGFEDAVEKFDQKINSLS